MNPDTGRIYKADGIPAWEDTKNLLFGERKVLEKVKRRLRMKSRCENTQRKAKRRIQKASRRRNRR